IEIGVGEATTLSYLIKQLNNQNLNIFGFDISWSRLKFAKELTKYLQIENVNLFVADLFNIPLNDNSIDIVYTNHSIEPNGGREEEALKELYRIC
ncbi:MAG TPA: class I SAM-dependent methyltransferase, partial [Ignavibacteriales bacterium]|nr:class I SAM-dependent methyltransferase [Ignavibacteriales bacterium]HPP33166.1 class I SAM-dependent methyltransferase [Ignavibacteriales bacterium]